MTPDLHAGDKPDPERPPEEGGTPPRGGGVGAESASQGTGKPDGYRSDGDKPKVISCLTDLAAADPYLKRIGAGPRGMTGAVVKEKEGHYCRDLATVRLDKATGEVSVGGCRRRDCTL